MEKQKLEKKPLIVQFSNKLLQKSTLKHSKCLLQNQND
jgi:hypothetical protein